MNDVIIENKLQSTDFAKMIDAFNDGSADSVELLPAIDFGFVKVQPLTVSRFDKGYAITTRLSFIDPIGNTVLTNTGTEERGIWTSAKKLELDLRKSSNNCEELGSDIAYGLSFVEKTVNYACMIRDEAIFKRFVVDSKQIDRQLERKEKEKEREVRHEELKPFAIVHADISKDLHTKSADLVPFFWEYDKYDLYGTRKSFCLLPRDFVMTLLKCEPPALVPEEQFSKAGRKILDDLVKKRFLKRREIAGKTYYFDLNTNTRTSLTKALRTSR